jgi:hypothetical protein
LGQAAAVLSPKGVVRFMLMGAASKSSDSIKEECARCRAIVCVSLALFLSTAMLILTYPGNLSPDSIASWEDAIRGEIFTVKPPLLSLMQQFFFSSFHHLRTAIAAFSFFQSFLFWIAILGFMGLLVPGDRYFYVGCAATVMLFPLWPYSTTHWTDVWVVIFCLPALAAFVYSLRSDRSTFGCLCFGLLFSLLAMSVRHNAQILVVLVMVVIFIWLGRTTALPIGKKFLSAAAVGGGLLIMTQVFYQFPQVKRAPSILGLSLVNQYLGTIALSEPGKRESLVKMEGPGFDRVFGPGKLEAALSYYDPCVQGELIWDFQDGTNREAVLGFEPIVNNLGFLVSGLIRVIAASPSGFLRHKAKYLWGQFHLSCEIFPFFWGVTKSNSDFAFRPWTSGSQTVLSFLQSNKRALIYRHWFMFLLGLSSVLIARPPFRASALLLSGFGVLYAAPYVALEPGCEWRYLMPSYVAFWLSAVGSVLSLTRVWTEPSLIDCSLAHM